MTTSQTLSIRLSSIRQTLNELAAKETLGEGEAATIEELRGELSDKETQYRAALTVEGEEEARSQGLFEDGDGEAAETRALLRDTPPSSYLTAASAGLGLTGAPAELNAALEVPIAGAGGGVAVPWAVLENRQALRPAGSNDNGEQRAFTDTGDLAGGVMQRPVLQRLFGRGIMAALGVRIDSVPAGRSEWPLLTAGVAPANVAEGTAAADAVAATFSTQTLKPKRLTGKYEYTHEQAAQVPMIESALRRDLADAVRSKMSGLILTGDAGTNVYEPNGFLTKLTAPTAPSTEADFAGYGLPGRDNCGRHSRVRRIRGCGCFGRRNLQTRGENFPDKRQRRIRRRSAQAAFHERDGYELHPRGGKRRPIRKSVARGRGERRRA